jgi:hypothetical protein
MLKRTLSLALLAFSLQTTFANYQCFYSKGDVFVEIDGQSSPFKAGDLFNQGTLIIMEDAYTMLVNEEERVIKFDKPGRYSFQDCGEVFQKADQPLYKKYLSYVAGKMTKKDKKDNLDMHASVHRGQGEKMRFPYPGEIVYSNSIIFTWNQSDGDNYFFHLTDSQGNQLLKLRMQDTSFALYTYSFNMQGGEEYQWYVTEDEFQEATLTYDFSMANDIQYDSYMEQEEKLLSDLSMNDPPEMLMLVDFYRSHKNFSAAHKLLCTLDSDSSGQMALLLQPYKELLE